MIAIITEKPGVAQDIARVLGVTQKKDGYIQGNGYMLTWAYGHLVTLALPEEYGFEGKKIEDYPFIPQEFKLVPRKVKGAGGYHCDPGAVKQLRAINKVFAGCSRIIVATDASREGELIFRHIYHYLKCRKPFSRLWISSLTDKAIREGLQNLRPGSHYDNLYLAAQARSQADWTLGLNASRALHIASGQNNNSLGRVQTPVLAMICKRFSDNRLFTPIPYWQNSVLLSAGGVSFRATGAEKYSDRELAERIFNTIKRCTEAKVHRYLQEEKKVAPPLLHDLASLQKLANTKYGFSAAKTLSVAQELYENRYLSYPRTGSRYIPADVFEEIPSLIAKLEGYTLFSRYARKLRAQPLNQKPVDAGKVTDHHALITTGIVPERLDTGQAAVYELVAGRMLEAFSGDGINDTVLIEAACGDLILEARKACARYNGWRDVFPDKEETGCQENEILPVLKEGDIVKIESLSLVQKRTKPEPLYTEATLLTAMETAGSGSQDIEIKEALTGCGIGTPATRAAIIETLFRREYICLQGKSLVPTQKGMELYKQVAGLQVADVGLTGQWEAALMEIEGNPEALHPFNDRIREFTKQVVTEIEAIVSPQANPIKTSFVCPRCNLGKMALFPKMTKCNYSRCGLILYREIGGKVLNDKAVKSLLLKRRTPLIKGFKGKQGKPFEARVVLDGDYKTKFEFPHKR